MVMGQVLVVAAAEGELQHLHAGEAALSQQLTDAVHDVAEVLRDDGQLAQRPFEGVKQLHPGADLPLAAAGRRAARRDGPVGVEAAEVVDAEQIVDAQRVPHPLDPPSIAGLAVVGPVVQRIAPKLAVGGKVIRRAAGHAGKAAVGVQFEQRAAHPSVHGVRRDVDGDIAEDLDALFVGVGFDLFPLGRELVLQELPEADLFLVFGAEALQRTAVPQTVLAGPLGPALHPVGGLERHVQGVIL